MSVTLGDIIAYIRADDTRAMGDMRKFENTVVGRLGTLGTRMATTLGVALGGALVAGGVVAGKFLLSTIGPASDLSETINKTTVVFGKNADEVLRWGKTAAQVMGMSENAALAAAGTYGNLFRAMGIGEGTSADMSKGLVELAGDLASFNNMDPTEVLDKLRSGLSGETEPLRSLGVNINQALLEEKAFELGLWNGVGALDASAKAQASYALIMEQTALAQGDFARTSNGLANQQRILKAKFEDLKATIGTALLPLVTDIVSRFNDFISRPETIVFLEKLTEKLGGIASGLMQLLEGDIQGALTTIFGSEAADQIMSFAKTVDDFINNTLLPFVSEHSEEIKGALIGIAVVLAGAGIVSAIAAIGAAISAIGLPVLAIIALAGLIGAAWNSNWNGIQEKTAAAIEFIRNIVSAGMAAVQTVVRNALTIIGPLFKAFQAAMQGDWRAFGQNLRAAWDAAWSLVINAAKNAWSLLKGSLTTLTNNAISFVKGINWGVLGKSIVQGIAKGILGNISFAINAVQNMSGAIMDTIKGFFDIESPSGLMEREIAPNLVKGAFNFKPFLNADLFKDLNLVPDLMSQGLAGFGANASDNRVTVIGNVSISARDERSLNSLLREVARA